jgi:uncharacterized protein YbaR (Trm112 family)
LEQHDIIEYYFFAFKLAHSTKMKRSSTKKKILACPKCVGPLEVAPDANGHFVPRGHFGVRQATQTDTSGQFEHPKCVAPLEMP